MQDVSTRVVSIWRQNKGLMTLEIWGNGVHVEKVHIDVLM